MYAGHMPSSSTNSVTWLQGEDKNSSHCIPIAELTRPDPILFYAEVPLFEDELHDNGASHLLVRIVSVLSLGVNPGSNLVHFSARYADLHLRSVATYS